MAPESWRQIGLKLVAFVFLVELPAFLEILIRNSAELQEFLQDDEFKFPILKLRECLAVNTRKTVRKVKRLMFLLIVLPLTILTLNAALTTIFLMRSMGRTQPLFMDPVDRERPI